MLLDVKTDEEIEGERARLEKPRAFYIDRELLLSEDSDDDGKFGSPLPPPPNFIPFLPQQRVRKWTMLPRPRTRKGREGVSPFKEVPFLKLYRMSPYARVASIR